MVKVSKRKIRNVERWCVDDDTTGKRRRQLFPSEESARIAAAELRSQVKDYGGAWLVMSPDRRAHVMAIVAEIDAAGVTLRHVWDSYRTRPAAPVIVTLSKVCSEMIAAKRAAGRREGYVSGLENVLSKFLTGREQQPITEVTTRDIEEWAGKAACVESRKTLISRASTLFSFAVKRGYTHVNPCTRIERPSVDHKAPCLFTVDQCRAALKWGTRHRRLMPWLILGLFAGLRPEEADFITKADITKDSVIVSHSKLRGHRRAVPLDPAAKAWLKGCKVKHLSKSHRRRLQRQLRDHLKLPVWPKDVLRHTAASYLLAKHQDAARVSLWLGNSPRVLLKHYQGIVTPKDTLAFWQLTPKSVVNAGRPRTDRRRKTRVKRSKSASA